MSEQIKDGGPAFPLTYSFESTDHIPPGKIGVAQTVTVTTPGMTLRDYFAAHAPTPHEAMPLAEHCAYRFRYADAMLAAREVKA